jgi:hypothetical protein
VGVLLFRHGVMKDTIQERSPRYPLNIQERLPIMNPERLFAPPWHGHGDRRMKGSRRWPSPVFPTGRKEALQ